MTVPMRRRPLAPDDLCRLIGIPFSDQQIDAITAPLEPGVIVAGAGSGKTTVMAARVVWAVSTGAVSPDQVLGLTFTNKAASELGARVRLYLTRAGLLSGSGTGTCTPTCTPTCTRTCTRTCAGSCTGPDSGSEGSEGFAAEVAEPSVLTYHAYAARLLHEHGLRIGHEPETTVMSDASRFQLAERAVRRHRLPIEHLTTSMSHVVRYVLALDAQLSEHLVSPDEVRTWQRSERPRWESAKQTAPVVDVLTKFAAREELLRLVEDYRLAKTSAGVMDFSDQMALSARLVEAWPEVGEQERTNYRVVLLDEYQDTSVAQARLLRALFSGGSDDAGRGHPVTAVGDPCQAIYGWRGASATNIDAFPADFPPRSSGRPETRRFPLNVNRRSLASVLDTANALAAPLYADHPGVHPLTAARGADAGEVRAAVVETFDDELDYLAREVPRAYERMSSPRWSDIGVLVRDNLAAAAVHDRLVAADVPVEVVGLSGLLTRPEVVEVVATLEVLHDVTANAALLQLLTGPRWNIGPRDLALLGRRARELAARPDERAGSLADALEAAVAGTDPADVASLLEALQSPGGRAFSAEARRRFSLLSQELRHLRRQVGAPLLDLVRRVIDVTGIDVELASSSSRQARARRDNLSTFIDAVASFAGLDSDASLPGLLAYLQAEEEYGRGMSLALPTEADSVKLLTVHKAKGLEWDVVFVPGLTMDVFPTRRVRPRWTTSAHELPWPLRGDAADLPQLLDCSRKGLDEFTASCRRHERLEELRLAYVAFTRPRKVLIASGYWWGPEQSTLRGPSEFLDTLLASMRQRGDEPELSFPRPPVGVENPSNRKLQSYLWPLETSGEELAGRRSAAALVTQAQQVGNVVASRAADGHLLPDETVLVQQWDLELARLVEEAAAAQATDITVRLPTFLSATTALRLEHDAEVLAGDLARPMPRRPSPAARFGTQFHAWVEAYSGQQHLLEPDELPGRGDSDIGSDAELQQLIETFTGGPFGELSPHRVEAPFALVLGGHVLRGRIDAVYETPTGYRVVDWKTSAKQTADPLQLAIYRLAWAELMEADLEQVEAAFYYVRSGEAVTYDDLPGRAELEQLLSG